MRKNYDLRVQPMSQQEQKAGLKLLEKAIKKGFFDYKKEHSPFLENCYLSTQDIEGLYFPNSELTSIFHKTFYDVECIAKVGGALGVCFGLKDKYIFSEKPIYLYDYVFISFEEMFFDKNELKIKNKILERIKHYEECYTTLTKIKRVRKKNGDNFADLLRNFEGANITLSYSLMDNCVSSLKINYDKIYIYRTQEQQQAHKTPTIEEIEQLIADTMQKYANYIAQEKDNLKKLHSNFNKFLKIAQSLKVFYKNTPNEYDFKSVLDTII